MILVSLFLPDYQTFGPLLSFFAFLFCSGSRCSLSSFLVPVSSGTRRESERDRETGLPVTKSEKEGEQRKAASAIRLMSASECQTQSPGLKRNKMSYQKRMKLQAETRQNTERRKRHTRAGERQGLALLGRSLLLPRRCLCPDDCFLTFVEHVAIVLILLPPHFLPPISCQSGFVTAVHSSRIMVTVTLLAYQPESLTRELGGIRESKKSSNLMLQAMSSSMTVPSNDPEILFDVSFPLVLLFNVC